MAEYRARADRVDAALLRHLALSAAALGLAALFAVPLGWWAFRSARAEAAIGGALNADRLALDYALEFFAGNRYGQHLAIRWR